VRDQEVDVPSRYPDTDEKGNLKKYPAGHPLYRPKEDDKESPKSRSKQSREEESDTE
jgi:hypothetical protein